MMSLWDALRMNMMISYQELVRTFPNIMKINAFKKRHLCIKSLNNCNQVYANDSDYVFSANRQTNKIV